MSDIHEIRTRMADAADRLILLPELIAQAGRDSNHREEIGNMNKWLKMKRLELEIEAGLILDEETQKKVNTNAEQREAWASKKMDSDPAIIAVAEKLKTAEANQVNAQINLDQLRQEAGALKAILAALTEELRTENIIMAAANRSSNVRVEVCHVAV